MNAAELLSLLSGVRSCGEGRWVARCPAHADRSPSLSLRRTHDRTLMHCWAGCKTSDVLAAIGLTLADLFDDTRKHFRPDTLAQRRRLAGEALQRWQQQEIRRCAEDLRTRDMIVLQINRAVHDGVFTENEALTSLEYEYRGYSELEYRFERLLRNQDTLQLWRESTTQPLPAWPESVWIPLMALDIADSSQGTL